MDLWVKGHLSWELEGEYMLVAFRGEHGIKELSRQRECSFKGLEDGENECRV